MKTGLAMQTHQVGDAPVAIHFSVNDTTIDGDKLRAALCKVFFVGQVDLDYDADAGWRCRLLLVPGNGVAWIGAESFASPESTGGPAC
jgi:hypothetical protein